MDEITPEMAAAYATQLRGNEAQNAMYSMSQLKPMQRISQQRQERRKAGETRLHKAMESQKSRGETRAWRDAQTDMNRRNYDASQADRATRVASQDRAADFRETQHSDMMDYRYSQQAMKGAGGPKIPTKAREKAVESIGALQLLQEVEDLTNSYTASQAEQADSPVADTALGMLGWVNSGAKRLADENLVHTDPKVREVRAKLARAQSDFRRMMSGLAVSGFEMAAIDEWSPLADGLSAADKKMRTVALKEGIGRQLKNMDREYGSDFYQQSNAGSGDTEGDAPPVEGRPDWFYDLTPEQQKKLEESFPDA